MALLLISSKLILGKRMEKASMWKKVALKPKLMPELLCIISKKKLTILHQKVL